MVFSKPPAFLDDDESGNWNNAEDYAKEKIMLWLKKADQYEFIATFGTSELVDQFIVNENTRNQARIMAINWLAKTLHIIICNAIFAIHKKDDEAIIKKLKDDIEKIIEVLPILEKDNVSRNHQTKESTVNIRPEFKELLRMLVDIKMNINIPLNRNNLLMRFVEQTDPRILKEQLKQRLMT